MSTDKIKIVVNKHMPKDEVWFVHPGKKIKIHVHEGPQSGSIVEGWMTKPTAVRQFLTSGN